MQSFTVTCSERSYSNNKHPKRIQDGEYTIDFAEISIISTAFCLSSFYWMEREGMQTLACCRERKLQRSCTTLHKLPIGLSLRSHQKCQHQSYTLNT
uniref:Uncharacterized protein n=1 Tax=Anguilla anguilla TaxID=7936 RepID=A0A0E9WBH5_ANGAN